MNEDEVKIPKSNEPCMDFFEEADLWMDGQNHPRFIPQLMTGYRNPGEKLFGLFSGLEEEIVNKEMDTFFYERMIVARNQDCYSRFLSTGTLYHMCFSIPTTRLNQLLHEMISLELLESYVELVNAKSYVV